uniref:Uncharacterized protein n=1 Tax=Serinus canaria TaxID=9135 RepID=A0A8C9L4E5_SERCA
MCPPAECHQVCPPAKCHHVCPPAECHQVCPPSPQTAMSPKCPSSRFYSWVKRKTATSKEQKLEQGCSINGSLN